MRALWVVEIRTRKFGTGRWSTWNPSPTAHDTKRGAEKHANELQSKFGWGCKVVRYTPEER